MEKQKNTQQVTTEELGHLQTLNQNFNAVKIAIANAAVEQKNQIEQDMAPFGFMDDGLNSESFTDADGDRWFQAKAGDEYGDMSHMWEYM